MEDDDVDVCPLVVWVCDLVEKVLELGDLKAPAEDNVLGLVLFHGAVPGL